MRYPLGIFALYVFSLFALGSTLHLPAESTRRPLAQNGTPTSVPVIVELFTSEGCSSCPPADTLLAKLEEQQPVANAQIIALEEHVDYWNSLGWIDPFSAEEWTSRQREYAGSLGSGNVYTPQMVINGRAELIGSREQQARQAIESAAARMRAEVSLAAMPTGKNGHADFKVSVRKLAGTKAGDAAEVWLAITETHLHSHVIAGENAGEDLHHASVLRALRKIGVADAGKDLSFSRDVSIALNSKWNRENLRAVAFVQEKKSHEIVGAALVRAEN